MKELISNIDLTTIVYAVLTVAWIIVRITPTKKDNDILTVIQKIVDYIIPNKKSGGGKHNKL